MQCERILCVFAGEPAIFSSASVPLCERRRESWRQHSTTERFVVVLCVCAWDRVFGFFLLSFTSRWKRVFRCLSFFRWFRAGMLSPLVHFVHLLAQNRRGGLLLGDLFFRSDRATTSYRIAAVSLHDFRMRNQSIRELMIEPNARAHNSQSK